MERDGRDRHHILIVEDDRTLATGLCRALQNESIEPVSYHSLREAGKMLKERQETGEAFSLIILDVNLPDGSGFDFLKEVKEKYDTIVIFLTANDMETDIVAGLEMGADDYITKPFSLAVLRARVETQLRRIKRQTGQHWQGVADDAVRTHTEALEAGERVVIDDYCFCFAQMLFYHGEEQIELSKTEQKLLRILVENRGMTLTREQLIEYIWSVESDFVDENALSVTVKRLRDKLGAQEVIKTVYGIGYTWVVS